MFKRMRGARRARIDAMNTEIELMTQAAETALPVCECGVDLHGAPSYENLADLISDMTDLLDDQHLALEKAKTLLGVFSMVGAAGKPIFRLDEGHSEETVQLITHAVLDLHAALNGSDAPAFVAEHRKLH